MFGPLPSPPGPCVVVVVVVGVVLGAPVPDAVLSVGDVVCSSEGVVRSDPSAEIMVKCISWLMYHAYKCLNILIA